MSIESYQVEILEALDGAGSSSIKQVISMVTYADEFSIVKDDLLELKEAGLIGKYSNGTWHITKYGTETLESLRAGKPEPAKPIAQRKPTATKPTQETYVTSVTPKPHPAIAALDRAGGYRKPCVENLELKLEVLDRLAELLSDDIRAVLIDIKSDLCV